MNILLTNDDGYDSKGIHLLKDKLKKYGRVVIVAPKGSMSAKSVSITIGKGIHVEKVDDETFICEGTPADCVSFGINALSIEFDLVVSGCNNGFNVSYDTMYSGTVGAALEALTYGIKSIAVSCEYGNGENFEIVDKYFDKVFKHLLDKELLSNECMLNINFPYGKEIQGIQISTLYYKVGQYDYFFEKEEDGYHAYRNLKTDFSDDRNSDCFLINNGIVSITPLNKSYFSKEIYEQIKKR